LGGHCPAERVAEYRDRSVRTSNYVRLGGLCFFVLIGCVITAFWLGVAGSTDGPRFTIVVLIGVAMMFCISILRIFDEERTEKRQFSNGEEQEARVPSGKRARRRQQRFINFVAPQLRANEQASVILSLAHEKVNALRLVGPEVAVVLTNQRVFEIRLQGIAARPNTTRATYARDSSRPSGRVTPMKWAISGTAEESWAS
jgi:hypothetical protein